MNEKPLVSILIPVWNREQDIIRAINSACSSSYRNIEIIVSDNASTDNTFDAIKNVAKDDARIQFYRNETNIGAVNNWVSCFEKSSGEFIKVLWSDDAITENTIEKLISPLLADDNVGFTYCKADRYIMEDDTVIDFKMLYSRKEELCIGMDELLTGFGLKLPRIPVTPGAALLRRNIILKTILDFSKLSDNCFDRAIGPDLMLIYNAVILGYKGSYVENTKVIFYADKSCITLTTDKAVLNKCYDEAVLQLLHNKNKEKKIFIMFRFLRSKFDMNLSRSKFDDIYLKEIKNISFLSILLKAISILIKVVCRLSLNKLKRMF